MRSKSVLASLAPQTIQMLYLQNFFLWYGTYACKGCEKKIFFSPDNAEKAFVASAKGSGQHERNLNKWAFSLDANKPISG